MAKIGILVASSNNNQKLGLKLKELALGQNCEVELINLVDLRLPLYSTVEEQEHGIPESAIDLASKLELIINMSEEERKAMGRAEVRDNVPDEPSQAAGSYRLVRLACGCTCVRG